MNDDVQGGAAPPESYRQSHLQPGYGVSYDEVFVENPHRALVWKLEREVLDRIVERRGDAGTLRHLDFACGTGRILAHLEPRATLSVGVDLSPSMLEVARRKVHKASLIQADLTQGDVLGRAEFDLITAFRFFPNAEPTLRREAMAALVRHLAPGGYLVFNNHCHTASLLARLARLLNRGGKVGMAQAEVDELTASAGLRIVETYGVGLVPATERHLWLPLFVIRPLETVVTRLRLFRGLAQVRIFVCSRPERTG